MHICTGASIPPEAMMHSLLFQISPCFHKIFRLCRKFSKFYLFPTNFSSAKISDDFFVIDHIFQISPYFPYLSTFPPCFAKIIISPPTFQNFPPVLEKFTCFLVLHTLCVFHFPPTLTMMHLCNTQCTYWMPLYMYVCTYVICMSA